MDVSGTPSKAAKQAGAPAVAMRSSEKSRLLCLSLFQMPLLTTGTCSAIIQTAGRACGGAAAVQKGVAAVPRHISMQRPMTRLSTTSHHLQAAKQAGVPAVATRRSKKTRLVERAASVDSEEPHDSDYFLPPLDGVFRAVAPHAASVVQVKIACE